MKKGMNVFRWLFLCTLLSGCASVMQLGRTEVEQMIQGTWTSEESVAVYEIGMDDGKMTVAGHSSHSGKEMMIGDVSWDGDVLRFTSYMPATDFKIMHENRMVDAQTMSSTTIGSSAHTILWKKQ